MKKFLALFLLMVSLGIASANAQLLTRDTISGRVQDTLLVNGSTNSGSGWFTNKQSLITFLEINNGTKWQTFQINYPTKNVEKFKAYHVGTDSTIGVYGLLNGISVYFPLINNDGTSSLTLDLGVTSKWIVRFRSMITNDFITK